MIPTSAPARVVAATVALSVTVLSAARPGAHEVPAPPRSAMAPRPAASVPSPPTLPPPLRALLREAEAVVEATVTRTEAYDEDRLHLHRLRVERLLSGRLAGGDPGLVEIRGTTARPPLVREGETLVLVVRPAPRLSYLRTHLPEGPWLETVGGREGIVRVASEAEADAVAAAVAEMLQPPDGDEAQVRALRRRQTFAALEGPSPRLASDAVATLSADDALLPLSAAELDAIARALRRPAVPADARAGLMLLLAQRNVREAVPALRAAEADAPAVLAALLQARRALGAPPDRAELAPWLASEDAGVRAVAVAALAAEPGDEALREVGRVATSDPDPGVRGAAVDALGASGRPEALPLVATTFDGSDRDLQQRSARAMMAIGGPAADDTLVRMALTGTTPESRSYAALVLLAMHGRDHASVRRLAEANPPEEVRRLLEHGLEMGHRHDTREHDH